MKKILDLFLIALVLFTVIITKDVMVRFYGSIVLIAFLIVRYFVGVKDEDSSKRNIYLLAAILYGIWTIIQGISLFS